MQDNRNTGEESVNDDYTRQEMYDCIGDQASVIDELSRDLGDIERALWQVCG